MNVKLYILKDGKPVEAEGFLEWALWHENLGNHILRVNYLDDRRRVSTVFIGCGHILFETAVFDGDHVADIERAATWEDAVALHERTVMDLTAASN